MSFRSLLQQVPESILLGSLQDSLLFYRSLLQHVPEYTQASQGVKAHPVQSAWVDKAGCPGARLVGGQSRWASLGAVFRWWLVNEGGVCTRKDTSP